MQQTASSRKYFFLIVLFAAFGLGLVLLAPFLSVIVISAALSVVFYPVYKWVLNNVTRGVSWVASLFTIVLFIFILCIPIFLMGVAIINQAQDIYGWVMANGGIEVQLTKLNKFFGGYIPAGSLRLEEHAASIAQQVTMRAGILFSGVLSTILSFLLIILTMFYFLKDGAQWKKSLVQLSPLSDDNDEKIITKLKLAVNGIFKGYILIGLAQGSLMGIGLWIFGVPNPALWGAITGIASLVPTIGTALVAVPSIIFLAAMDKSSAAIGLAIWSTIVVGTIDNFLNPLIVGKKIDIHPLLILFAVLGGIALMGPTGILVGPLVISFIYALMSVYKYEMV